MWVLFVVSPAIRPFCVTFLRLLLNRGSRGALDIPHPKTEPHFPVLGDNSLEIRVNLSLKKRNYTLPFWGTIHLKLELICPKKTDPHPFWDNSLEIRVNLSLEIRNYTPVLGDNSLENRVNLFLKKRNRSPVLGTIHLKLELICP